MEPYKAKLVISHNPFCHYIERERKYVVLDTGGTKLKEFVKVWKFNVVTVMNASTLSMCKLIELTLIAREMG